MSEWFRHRAGDGCRWMIRAAMALIAMSAIHAEPVPQRIVSLSPNLTQILFALGAGERVVAVSDFCLSPPEALRLPRAGGYINPNYEILTAMQPDLILVLGRQETVTRFAQERGIRLENFEMNSLATIRAGIVRLGGVVAREDAATSIVARFDAKLAQLRQARDRRAGPPPRVFLSLSREAGRLASLFTVAGGTFLDEALTLAGGVNIFHDVTQPWPQISKETLLVRQPEVILELEPGWRMSAAQRDDLLDDWQSLPTLPAVAQGRIAVMTQPDLLIAGLNFPDVVEAFQRAIFPSASADEKKMTGLRVGHKPVKRGRGTGGKSR